MDQYPCTPERSVYPCRRQSAPFRPFIRVVDICPRVPNQLRQVIKHCLPHSRPRCSSADSKVEPVERRVQRPPFPFVSERFPVGLLVISTAAYGSILVQQICERFLEFRDNVKVTPRRDIRYCLKHRLKQSYGLPPPPMKLGCCCPTKWLHVGRSDPPTVRRFIALPSALGACREEHDTCVALGFSSMSADIATPLSISGSMIVGLGSLISSLPQEPLPERPTRSICLEAYSLCISGGVRP